MKPPKLSVHKSNVLKRERRQLREELRGEVERLTAESNVVGYALVVFDDQGNATSAFDTGRIMPLWAFPGACEYVLKTDISAVEEDYRAPLLKKDRPFK